MDLLAFLDIDQVRAWMEFGGYFLLFALLFACGLGMPLPEDIPLMLAGFFAATGKMNLAIAAVVAWCGIIGGDCMLYHLGKKYGLNITRVPYIGKHVTAKRIEMAEHFFMRYGVWVVGVGRMFAGIRGAMVVAAGAIRFNFIKFIIADGLAAIVSGGLFVAIGHWIGTKVRDAKDLKTFIAQNIEPYKHGFFMGLLALAILIGLYIYWRHKRHKTLTEAAMEKVDHVVESHPPK